MTEEFLCFKRTKCFWDGLRIMPCPDCDKMTKKMMEQDEVCKKCEKLLNIYP